MARSTSKYRYRVNPNSEEDMERYAKTQAARANRQGGNFQGIIMDDYQTFKARKGENSIRILPPTWEDADHYAIDLYSHYSVGPDNATVLCLAKNKAPLKPKGFGNACPICQAHAKAARDGDEDLAKELNARNNSAMWVVDLKEKEKGPVVWVCGWTIERDIAKLSRDKESGASVLLDHPDEGYNIQFDRDGEGLKTRYNGYQTSKRPSSIDPDWLEYIKEAPLPDCLVWRTYDEIQELFEGGVDDDDKPVRKNGRARQDDDDDDDTPPPRKARRMAVEEDEEDDEDDAPPPRKARRAVDDDEEDVRPAKLRDRRDRDDPPPRRAAPVRKAAPEPEEEEVDDEPPVRTRRTRTTNEDEEAVPVKGKFKPKGRTAREDDDDPPPRKAARRPATEDEDEIEEEDDDAPAARPGKSRAAELRAKYGR